jgi:hypothetical protein
LSMGLPSALVWDGNGPMGSTKIGSIVTYV